MLNSCRYWESSAIPAHCSAPKVECGSVIACRIKDVNSPNLSLTFAGPWPNSPADPKTEVSEAVAALQTECAQAQINEAYREDFLVTLNEIRICFDDTCFIAAIGLCGKILEVCLKEILQRHNVQYDPNAMVGTLIKAMRDRVPQEYLDSALTNVVNIINASRITAVHAKERIPVPSRDQAIMVIFATRDVVRRNLSHTQGPG